MINDSDLGQGQISFAPLARAVGARSSEEFIAVEQASPCVHSTARAELS